MKSSDRPRLVFSVLAVLLVIGILVSLFWKSGSEEKTTGPATAARDKVAAMKERGSPGGG